MSCGTGREGVLLHCSGWLPDGAGPKENGGPPPIPIWPLLPAVECSSRPPCSAPVRPTMESRWSNHIPLLIPGHLSTSDETERKGEAFKLWATELGLVYLLTGLSLREDEIRPVWAFGEIIFGLRDGLVA